MSGTAYATPEVGTPLRVSGDPRYANSVDRVIVPVSVVESEAPDERGGCRTVNTPDDRPFAPTGWFLTYRPEGFADTTSPLSGYFARP